MEDSGLGCGWPGSPLEVKTWLMGKGEAGLMETGNICHPCGWSWYLHVFFQLGALPLDKRNYSSVSHCPHQFKLSGMGGGPLTPAAATQYTAILKVGRGVTPFKRSASPSQEESFEASRRPRLPGFLEGVRENSRCLAGLEIPGCRKNKRSWACWCVPAWWYPPVALHSGGRIKCSRSLLVIL